MTSDKHLEQVREFHQAFGIHEPAEPAAPAVDAELRPTLAYYAGELAKIALMLRNEPRPDSDPHNTAYLRLQLIVEETAELAVGLLHGDKQEVLDALCDLSYVVDGSWLMLGMADLKERALDEVHRSNMSKLVNGMPLKDHCGRVVKGPDYSPPDLGSLL